MQHFIDDYGTKEADGKFKLTPSFLSVTASVIYVGEFVGALITAPINDRWGRRAVFLSASLCIILGALIQGFSHGLYGVFCVGRVFIGLGIGESIFSRLLWLCVADLLPRSIHCYQFGLHRRSGTYAAPRSCPLHVPVLSKCISICRSLHQPRD